MLMGSKWPDKVRKASMKLGWLTTPQRLKWDLVLCCHQLVRILGVHKVDKEREGVSRVNPIQMHKGSCFYHLHLTPCRTSLRVAARLRRTNSAFIKIAGSYHRRALGLQVTKSRQTLVKQTLATRRLCIYRKKETLGPGCFLLQINNLFRICRQTKWTVRT